MQVSQHRVFLIASMLSVVLGLDQKFGTFKVINKHPELNACALDILKKNEYVALRVHEETGQCQGLTHDWGLFPSFDKGFAYATKHSVLETFQSPVDVYSFCWSIPGMIKTSARVDTFVTFERGAEVDVNFTLTGKHMEEDPFIITIKFLGESTHAVVHPDGSWDYLVMFQDLKEEVQQISLLLMLDTHVNVLQNKRVVTPENVPDIMTLNQIQGARNLCMEKKNAAADKVFLHGIQYKKNGEETHV